MIWVILSWSVRSRVVTELCWQTSLLLLRYRMICRKFNSDEFSRLRRLLEGLKRRFQERLFQDTASFSIGCNH